MIVRLDRGVVAALTAAFLFGAGTPFAKLLVAQADPWMLVARAAVLGFLSYGASLVLFVVALRSLGTARTGAYFSVASFFGTLLGAARSRPCWRRPAADGLGRVATSD